MSQKIERVELEVDSGGRRVPAHPAFKRAFEALPNIDFKGLPWGVPQEVWLSGDDLVALGVPAERGLFRDHTLHARLFTTQAKRRGELPVVTVLLIPRVRSKELLPAGVMGLRSSLANAQRDRSHGNDLRFWQWRCRIHEDCLALPELGMACLARGVGPGFVPGLPHSA